MGQYGYLLCNVFICYLFNIEKNHTSNWTGNFLKISQQLPKCYKYVSASFCYTNSYNRNYVWKFIFGHINELED